MPWKCLYGKYPRWILITQGHGFIIEIDSYLILVPTPHRGWLWVGTNKSFEVSMLVSCKNIISPSEVFFCPPLHCVMTAFCAILVYSTFITGNNIRNTKSYSYLYLKDHKLDILYFTFDIMLVWVTVICT